MGHYIYNLYNLENEVLKDEHHTTYKKVLKKNE